MTEGRNCFLNAERTCAKECAAFNEKTQNCKLLERSAMTSRLLRQLMVWLGQHDPPQVR